ncbi:MAG: PKD domain-containing protein [Thermoanaerobaculia bacterium]
MLVKVLTLRFDSRLDGSDDTPLATFTRGKEILFVKDGSSVRDDVPRKAFLSSPASAHAHLEVPMRQGHRRPYWANLAALALGLGLAGPTAADTGYSNLFTIDRGMAPGASFTWSPESPEVGQPVQFTIGSTEGLASWTWDLDGDGRTDVFRGNPNFTYQTPGARTVTLRTTSIYGAATSQQTVFVAGATGGPVVTSTKWDYPGFFLEGTALENRLTATVDWAGGSPGTVQFAVNGGSPVIEPGTAIGASHLFDLSIDFPARLAASTVTITPVSAAGAPGVAKTERIHLFPYPTWLSQALSVAPGGEFPASLEFKVGSGEVTGSLAFEAPAPKLMEDCRLDCAVATCDDACLSIPAAVPIVAGTFSLLETYGGVRGTFSSTGRGRFSLYGSTGFFALGGGDMGGGIQGTLTGSGEFQLRPMAGLEWTSASISLDVDGTISKSFKATDVPYLGAGLRFLEALEIFGGPVTTFNQSAKLIIQLQPGLSLTGRWQQDSLGDLVFSETEGELRLSGKATLVGQLTDDLKVEIWGSLGGSVTVGLPQPMFRGGEIFGEVVVRFRFPFWKPDPATVGFYCPYTLAAGWSGCRGGSPSASSGASAVLQTGSALHEVRHDYAAHGALSRFEGRPRMRVASSAVPVSVTESSLVANVYPDGSPVLVPAGGNTRLLLWVQQDPGLPVAQSTDIAWSYFDGTTWTAPALVQHDTQAELGPVAALTASGKVVAAWLRNKDAAFSTPIASTGDLPLFYNRLEVVTAAFDPATQSWSAVTPLTDDDAFDGSLSMAGDGTGNVLLTWLTNAGGEFQSTAASPSLLKAALWNGSAFDAPIVVASGLAGVSGQSSARFGAAGAIVLSRDPDPGVLDDDVVVLYPWNGTAWGSVETFASGSGGNRRPLAAYTPDGILHVVWLRGGDLVEGAPGATPSLLRADSESVGFYGSLLVAGPSGTLTLVYQEVADNGPANLFARIYDPASGTWSEDRRLTQDQAMAHDLHGFHASDGRVHLAYLATEIGRTTKDVVIDGEPVTLTNIPVPGQTDLRVLEHQFVVDLAVAANDVKVAPPYPDVGETVNVSLDVHNAGHFATGQFEVGLYVSGGEGCPDSCPAPVKVAEATVTAPFAAGEVRRLAFTFVQPADARTLSAVVDTLDDVTELTKANNQVEWAFGNRPPVARILPSATAGTPPVSITFDATGSLDPDGDALTFSWAFADGTAGAEGAVVVHEFTTSGRFPVTLAVRDSKGSTSTAVVYISTLATCANVTAPSLAAPGLSLSGADYIVSWTETSPVGAYELQESADAAFTAPATIVEIGTHTSFRHEVVTDVTYYYRARALDSCGGTTHTSTWSAPVAVSLIAPATALLSVTKAGAGTGDVFSSPLGISCGGSCAASFATGTVVTLTPVPNPGSTFAGWSGACSGTGTCAVTMSSAQAVTATFALAPVLPQITSFTATPSVRTSAGASTLAWTTTGATSVSISGLGGTFALSGTRDVSVAATTTYTLTATNAAGNATATATVNVLPGAGTSLGTPVITAPSAGQVVAVAGVGFTWNAVASAAGYDVKLYSAMSGVTVFAGSLVGNASSSTLVTLPDGAYLFAVRACNASGFANSNCGAFATRSFSVAKTSPTGAPTVTAPAQGAVLTASTQIFSWTAVPKVDPGLSLSYEVLLTDVAGGNTPDLQITVPDPTLSTIYTLHSSALYELKVRACQAGCGPWSTPVTFGVDLPEVPTTAPSVPTCSVSGGNSLTCSWSAVSGADVYSFYVVQPTGGPGGGALTVAARLVSETTVPLPVPQGFANVIVAACTGDGCGPYSGAQGINPAGPNPSSPNLGTPLAASVVNGPGVEFSWNRIPGDDGTNTWYRLYVQDLSRQAAALDVYTRDNFYAAYFKAEGARYDALVVANPGASQVVGPPIGFNVRGLSASAPTMVSPPHQSQVQAGNLQLGWSPVPGATLYQYWVAVLGQGTPAVTGVTPGLVVQVPLPAVAGQPTTYSGITRACMSPTGCSPTSDTGWGPWSNAPGGPGVTNFTVVP